MRLELVRKIFSSRSTIGDMSIDGVPYCKTLELPWRDNANNISCIPEGAYKVPLTCPLHIMRDGHISWTFPAGAGCEST